jgi:hypothetical protein
MRRALVLLTTIALIGACTDRTATGPESGVAAMEDDGSAIASGAMEGNGTAASNVRVASVNVYFGAPVEPVLDAPQDSIPFRVAEAWAILELTDFPSRARALAAELAKSKPHLIGLQEVADLRTEPVFDPDSPAEDEYLDFLTILVEELAARNVDYDVAISLTTTDIELPKFDGVTDEGQPIISGVRLIDRDAILVRSDVPWSEEASNLYSVFLGPSYDPNIPIPIDVLRGWTAVTASVHGTDFRFVNTHLESEDRGPLHQIRTGQAQELALTFMGESRPLIVVGDFNSGPGRPLGEDEYPAYQLLTDAGFTDAWLLQPGKIDEGFTCCHDGDLSNTQPGFLQRIDLVLLRNMNGLGPQGGMPQVQASVFNNEPKDLKKYGVWSSDHGHVVAHIVLPKPQMAKK